jgi:hypothetical protein
LNEEVAVDFANVGAIFRCVVNCSAAFTPKQLELAVAILYDCGINRKEPQALF